MPLYRPSSTRQGAFEPARRWADHPEAEATLAEGGPVHGTHALLFEPEVFVERLAAIIPAPMKNMVHYHGVFASASRWRPFIVPDGVRRQKKARERRLSKKAPGYDERWIAWEDLIYRVFGRDVLLHNGCVSGLWRSNLVG